MSAIQRMCDAWWFDQGVRVPGSSVPEVKRALEHIAHPLCRIAVLSGEPKPPLLTKRMVREAQHRAISQRRRAEHGPPPRSRATWWGQIEAIAKRWGIETTLEEWADGKTRARDVGDTGAGIAGAADGAGLLDVARADEPAVAHDPETGEILDDIRAIMSRPATEDQRRQDSLRLAHSTTVEIG